MATFASPLLKALNDRVTYATVNLQGVVSGVFTLDGALSMWAYKVIQGTIDLQGLDFATAAQQFAADYCFRFSPPDCVLLSTLPAQYAAIATAARTGAPIPPFPPIPTPSGVTVGTGAGYGPAPAYDPNATPPGPGMTTTPAPSPTPTPTPTPAPSPAPTPAPAPTPTPAPAPTTTPVTLMSGATPKFIIAAGGAIGAAGAGLSAAAAAITFGVSIVATVLLGLFSGWFGGNDCSAVAKQTLQLRQSLAQTADELERFSWSVATGLGRLWQAVAEIWDNFLDGLWTYLKQLWNLLWTVVSSVIPKIINVLRDLRKFLDNIYVKYILPALRYLQYVRAVLGILRAMGVPIATKLDRILGQIQAALFGPFLWLLGVVNGLGSWYNVILTAGLILQRPVFFNSMYAYQADWINLFWAAQTASQGASGLPTGAGGGAPLTDAQIFGQIQQYATTGTGAMVADVADAQLISAALAAGA